MDLTQKLHFAEKRIKSSRKMGIFAVIIIVIGFILLYSSVILFEGLKFGEKAVENSLDASVSACGIMEFQGDSDVEKWDDFFKQIYALDEIKAIGSYDCYGIGGLSAEGNTDYWGRMLEIQNSGNLEFEDGDPSSIQEVVMNKELLGMEKIDLIAGEKNIASEPGKYPVFLGYNYREIPVGTVFKDDNFRYEVVGIMEKGTYVTDPHLLTWNIGGLTMAYKVNLDNMILMLLPEGTVQGVRNVFCVNDGYTYENAVFAMKEIGDEWGLKVDAGTLQARLDTVFSENKKFKIRIDGIAVIICISVYVICITVQILGIYMKRNELGIWLANGMSRKDVFTILWLENFIKVITGVGIAVILEGILMRLLFWNNGSVFREIASMMYAKPLLEIMIFAVLLICVISIIPIIIIGKKPATELVKGIWN